MLTKSKSGINNFLKQKPKYVFFLKFNFEDNHVFDFYPTFVGKPDIRGKHQKNLQNVENFMTIFCITCFCESVRGSFALTTKVFKHLVSSPDIFLQYEPSGSMMVFLFFSLWYILVKERHDKKILFFLRPILKCLSQAQFK